MAAERLVLDANGNAALGAITNDANLEMRNLRVDPTTGRLLVDTSTSGGVAHDAADSGNPVKIGAYAANVNRTRVASGDRVDVLADLAGRLIANLGQVRELRKKQTTTITSSTSETTIVTAGGAGVYNDLVAIVISNTSATATRVDIRDDTAGTILFSLYIPAGDMRGFALPGASIPQTATNKNWTAQCGTSVDGVRILAIYEQNT